jgi:hypothetical protein
MFERSQKKFLINLCCREFSTEFFDSYNFVVYCLFLTLSVDNDEQADFC